MMNLKQLLTRPLRRVPNSIVVVLLVIAFIGFADASYLTLEHYQNAIPPCSVGGCEQVLTSAYSTVLGIPVSLVGALYYLVILIGTFSYLEGKREKIFRNSLLLTTIGFLVSVFFFVIQAFVLHSFCLYCLGSAATSTLLFVIAIVILKKYQVEEI